MSIQVFLSENFQIFKGVYIVSAVFNVTANVKKLDKPATLTFPHCVDIKTQNDIDKLRFYVQHENCFEVIDGNFEIASALGSVELLEFSNIFIVFFQYVKNLFYEIVTKTLGYSSGNEESISAMRDRAHSQEGSSFQPSDSKPCKEQAKTDHHPDPSNFNYIEILYLPENRERYDDWNACYCITHSIPTFREVE